MIAELFKQITSVKSSRKNADRWIDIDTYIYIYIYTYINKYIYIYIY